jgi:D-3-phosphoglycerate dehydrogenase
MVIRTYTTVDKTMIESASNLKVIGRAGAGVDNIDLQASKERGITVVYTPEANSDSVVEFVLTTMLAHLRILQKVTGILAQEEWNALRDASINQKELTEITLGIVGFGRIGSRLGKAAASLGINVLFHDLLDKPQQQCCQQAELEKLLKESDVISIHVDGRKENKHLCNSEMYKKMKQNVLFMNASRGFVVDAYALTDFLLHNTDAHAILDVHDPEPISNEYPLLHVPNATLYPHIACKTKTATINMGWVVKDVDAVLRGEEPVFKIV